jgi:pimeloyl-ACP methyl ester carboxylesterase
MTTSLQTAITPRFRTIDGLSIRYAESEDPGRGAHALLLSPWPESLYAFEATWSRLAAHAHLVAVDLPGFGRSERRDALMTPHAMGEFVVRLADAFGLEQPHVVGPDVGTGASLFAAARHPGRFRSLVVGSGGAAFPLQLGGVLMEWIEAPDLEPYRRAGGRAIVGAAIGTLERYTLSDAAREDYLASYEGDKFADSMAYVRAYPTDVPALGACSPGSRPRPCHRRPARRRRPAGERGVPARAAAGEQARVRRHRALHVGGRGRRVRCARRRLVGRRVRGYRRADARHVRAADSPAGPLQDAVRRQARRLVHFAAKLGA